MGWHPLPPFPPSTVPPSDTAPLYPASKKLAPHGWYASCTSWSRACPSASSVYITNAASTGLSNTTAMLTDTPAPLPGACRAARHAPPDGCAVHGIVYESALTRPDSAPSPAIVWFQPYASVKHHLPSASSRLTPAGIPTVTTTVEGFSGSMADDAGTGGDGGLGGLGGRSGGLGGGGGGLNVGMPNGWPAQQSCGVAAVHPSATCGLPAMATSSKVPHGTSEKY
eukprot:287229-Chlamydomonas_euryale.AAC.9